MSNRYILNSIPGDGIGLEVLPVGQRLIDAVADKCGFSIQWVERNWSCELYATTGQMMPDDAIDQLKDSDAIYLGACGWPSVPDHISLWNMLLPMRRELDLYANVRPVKLLKGMTSPLANRTSEDIDFVIVRENVEGEYSEIGGRLYGGTDQEQVSQLAVFTRHGTDRILRYAFETARSQGRKHVTSATKSNGIKHTMPFWDERFKAISSEYSDIDTSQYHIDILTAHFVQHPDWFDVVVGSNLFGDILSDLGPAIAGSIGIAPSSNINPEGKYPSLFEPVHGSAPDIAGQGIANPIASVWTAAIMLDHIGEHEAHNLLMQAIEETLQTDSGRTRDLGGSASTVQCETALKEALLAL